jgi:predicted nucleotidyltransferase
MGALRELLKGEFLSTDGLVAGYLFGSVLHPSERQPRDIDVAVLWKDAMSPPERLMAGEDLGRRIERALPERKHVDVVDLRSAPPSLLRRVLVEGERICVRDHVSRVRFEAAALSRAIDFLEWQKPYLDRWLRRIANGR